MSILVKSYVQKQKRVLSYSDTCVILTIRISWKKETIGIILSIIEDEADKIQK